MVAKIELTPIGFVRAERKEAVDDDWGGSVSQIELSDTFSEEALAGLESFSHAEILFYFDRVRPEKIETAARHPRNNPDWLAIGIFAQRANANAFVLFACQGDQVVGAAVCVWSFSTFTGRSSVNLHDFSVLPDAKGCGVGTALLEELERRARARDASKMTLEVHDSNLAAKRLYERFGFQGWSPPTLFVAKPL